MICTFSMLGTRGVAIACSLEGDIKLPSKLQAVRITCSPKREPFPAQAQCLQLPERPAGIYVSCHHHLPLGNC